MVNPYDNIGQKGNLLQQKKNIFWFFLGVKQSTLCMSVITKTVIHFLKT